MPSFPYITGIPAGPDNPSQDQPNMQTNTNSINSIIGVDHYTFQSSTNSDGWHKQSTYPFLTVAPTTTNVQGAVYTKDVGGGQIELFYRHPSNGSEIQITNSTGLFNVPTILSGTFLTTNAFTNIVLLPANVYGYIIFFSSTSPSPTQMSPFFTTATNATGYSTRVVRNGSSIDNPVELNNFSATLNLQGKIDDFPANTFNFRAFYWNI